MTRHRASRKKLIRCSHTGLVVFNSELEAKIVLAHRIRRDKGEIRYFSCGDHFHLAATDLMEVE
ncbi:MAG: hypothetical protein LC687_05255 [Actinobacteria bacterium]|nr:hypothetical protein [Actinomycetota bacterium]